MHNETFLMTKAGLEKLKQELKQLESVNRENTKQRIKHARSFCDFREDSEYDMAVKEMENIETRVSRLKYMIQQAEIIENSNQSQVALGSTISFKTIPYGEIETYMIVGTEEADPLKGKISNNTPIAKSLLGAEVNDEVTMKTPGGKSQVKIVSIS